MGEMMDWWTLCVMTVLLKTHLGFGQSLARLKNVTMSSQHEDWAGPRIVDGDYNRNAGGCGCCAATSIERDLVDQWMEIDFGEPNTFNRIVVHGRNDQSGRQDLVGLAIHLDNSGVSIASIDDDQVFVNFYHFDLGKSYSARRIRFILKGTDKVLAVCEVDVFNDGVVSNAATPETSSTYSDWSAGRSLDGATGNPDNCLCCSATNEEPDPWLRIDLGTTFLITYIDIHGRTDPNAYQQSLQGLEVDVAGVVIEAIPTTGTFISSYQIFPSPETIGRVLRFTLKGTNRLLVMCEVAIYGERVVSVGRQAYSSSLFDNWFASRAVDGDYTTNAPAQYCAATKQETNPWLRVDLGLGYTVSRIVIYGRTDSEYGVQNFGGLSIEINSITVDLVPATTDWVYFHGVQLTRVQQADNVTVVLLGFKLLVVCELLLYGDCVDGYFGEVCDRQCHCEEASCPTISGICPTGRCLAGYRTGTCSEECEDGKYGHDCAMFCSSNCKDGRPCNHITGHCEECKPGYTYTDPFCRTPCDDDRYGNNCSQTCGNCRDGQPCDFVTGNCTECEDGYKYSDVYCRIACDGRTYGKNCIETCGNCRDGKICNTVNGMCTECMDGYLETDTTCKTQCLPGYYGRNCINKCGSCRTEPCNYISGQCDDCANGTFVDKDKLCNTSCAANTYGYNCTGLCGNCRGDVTCDLVDGVCRACDDGYDMMTDSQCNTVCALGFYGFYCLNECGFCFDNATCDHVNGSCSRCAAGYQGELCTARLVGGPPSDDGDGSNIIVIIGVVVPVVLIIVIVTIVVIVLRRRRLPRQPMDDHTKESERIYANSTVFDNVVAMDTDSQDTSKRPQQDPVEKNEESEYYNFTSPGIQVNKLWDYIAKHKENKGEGFLKEFKELKEGLIHPYNDAIANRAKNRYREMYPYDHSRVHLDVEREGESEFINASHIDGYERQGKFIASQGPIGVMVDDFWRMVWQQKSTKIVMLTNLVEGGTTKCIQYWPKEITIDYGRIQITLVNEDTVSDYSVRTLDITQDNEPPRRIKQYHYKAWPDKDVPDSTWSLVQFWREVFDEQTDKPVVVHCSAGVGRTGTFIAMDNLYHQAVATGSVTPYTIVETLRNQRIKMVQTSEQYEYLHEAVADALLFGTHYLWESQFLEYYAFMVQKDETNGGKIRLKQQFECLEKSVQGKIPANGVEGGASGSREIDEYRPKSIPKTRDDIGRLPPLSLPSLGGSDSFILTPTPNSQTVTGCWKLIDDLNIKTVITLGDGTKSDSSISTTKKSSRHFPQAIKVHVVAVGEEVPYSFCPNRWRGSEQITDLCNTVVSDGAVLARAMCYVSSKSDKIKIWASMNKQTCDTYCPIKIADTKMGSLTERTFTYSKKAKAKGNQKDSKIKQIEFVLSPDKDPVQQAASMSEMLELVSAWHQYISTKEPLMIQCSDGVSTSAVTAVVLNEKLRLLKNGGQLHILGSVMQLIRENASCIASYNQYKFIHDIMFHMLKKKDDVYSEAAEHGGQVDVEEDENIYQNT